MTLIAVDLLTSLTSFVVPCVRGCDGGSGSDCGGGWVVVVVVVVVFFVVVFSVVVVVVVAAAATSKQSEVHAVSCTQPASSCAWPILATFWHAIC